MPAPGVASHHHNLHAWRSAYPTDNTPQLTRVRSYADDYAPTRAIGDGREGRAATSHRRSDSCILGTAARPRDRCSDCQGPSPIPRPAEQETAHMELELTDTERTLRDTFRSYFTSETRTARRGDGARRACCRIRLHAPHAPRAGTRRDGRASRPTPARGRRRAGDGRGSIRWARRQHRALRAHDLRRRDGARQPVVRAQLRRQPGLFGANVLGKGTPEQIERFALPVLRTRADRLLGADRARQRQRRARRHEDDAPAATATTSCSTAARPSSPTPPTPTSSWSTPASTTARSRARSSPSSSSAARPASPPARR